MYNHIYKHLITKQLLTIWIPDMFDIHFPTATNFIYSGDLNNEHLNTGNIWITNFYLSSIQLSGIHMVVWYLDHYFNTWPFGNWTTFDHLNTGLLGYSDPHFKIFFFSKLIVSNALVSIGLPGKVGNRITV